MHFGCCPCLTDRLNCGIEHMVVRVRVWFCLWSFVPCDVVCVLFLPVRFASCDLDRYLLQFVYFLLLFRVLHPLCHLAWRDLDFASEEYGFSQEKQQEEKERKTNKSKRRNPRKQVSAFQPQRQITIRLDLKQVRVRKRKERRKKRKREFYWWVVSQSCVYGVCLLVLSVLSCFVSGCFVSFLFCGIANPCKKKKRMRKKGKNRRKGKKITNKRKEKRNSERVAVVFVLKPARDVLVLCVAMASHLLLGIMP